MHEMELERILEKIRSNSEKFEKSCDKAAIAFLLDRRSEGESHLHEAMISMQTSVTTIRHELTELNARFVTLLDEKDTKINNLAQAIVNESAFLFIDADDDLLFQPTQSTSAIDQIAGKDSASPDQKLVASEISTLFESDFADVLDVHQTIDSATVIIDFDAENPAVQPETIETLLTSTPEWLKRRNITYTHNDWHSQKLK